MKARWHAALGVGFVLYGAAAALPAEWVWFDPSAPVFLDARAGQSPHLEDYSRRILTDAFIRYVAVVRGVGDNLVACTGEDGPFPYHPAEGPVLGKDLAWWTGDAPDCRHLPPGTYWTVTTWTIERPAEAFLPPVLDDALGWLLPPKRVSREGPPFTIHEAKP